MYFKRGFPSWQNFTTDLCEITYTGFKLSGTFKCMFNSLPCCKAVMDRVGVFLDVVLTMSLIFLEQEIVFSFMDKSGEGVGGFMWAASGTKSIKDGELGPWT